MSTVFRRYYSETEPVFCLTARTLLANDTAGIIALMLALYCHNCGMFVQQHRADC